MKLYLPILMGLKLFIIITVIRRKGYCDKWLPSVFYCLYVLKQIIHFILQEREEKNPERHWFFVCKDPDFEMEVGSYLLKFLDL